LSEQDETQATTLKRPANDDKEAWYAYWKAQGQPWRWEPEISEERQRYLAEQRKIKPSFIQGIYPFKGIKLSRADIEWLLAIHEVGQRPVDWSDERQRGRKGFDLRGADLRGLGLSGLPLAKCYLYNAHLEGANLNSTHLEGVILIDAFFDSATTLYEIVLSNNKYGTASLVDIHWGDVNVAVVDWSKISSLGDEYRFDYERAARAYRQLSVVLRNQGINEHAARFTYRSQLMQRKLFWYQRKYLQYLGSLFLDLLSGYGYKPLRCFVAYLLVILTFATVYFIIGHTVGPVLSPLGSIVFSMTSFHGRGFFPGGIALDDPLTVVAALEAFIVLLIEVTFITTLTQRLFCR